MHEVGARKLFVCPYCGLTVDRDIAAARNVALKLVNDKSVSAAEEFFKKAVPLAGSGAASYRLAGGSFREELPRRNCSMEYS